MNKKRLGAAVYDVVFSKMRLYDLIMKIGNSFGLKNYRQEILHALDVERGDCILEIGVGSGENLGVLKELYGNSFDFFGIDLSPNMISNTEKRAEKQSWLNVDLTVLDAENLSSYNIKNFDKVLCINSVNFYENREKTLEMMVDILKPGGKLLISDVYLPDKSSVFSLCLGKLISNIYSSISGFNLRPPIEAPKDTKEIISILSPSKIGISPYFKIFQKRC